MYISHNFPEVRRKITNEMSGFKKVKLIYIQQESKDQLQNMKRFPKDSLHHHILSNLEHHKEINQTFHNMNTEKRNYNLTKELT